MLQHGVEPAEHWQLGKINTFAPMKAHGKNGESSARTRPVLSICRITDGFHHIITGHRRFKRKLGTKISRIPP